MELTTTMNGRADASGKALRDVAAKISAMDKAAILNIAEQAMHQYIQAVVGAVSKRTRRGSEGQRRLEDYAVANRGDEVTGTVTLTPGLGLQEYGGIMRVKNAQYLTIPLPAAMSGGRPKRLHARDWADAFVIRSRRGNLVLVRRQGGKIIPLYALEKSVRIRARLGLRKEMRSQHPQFMREIARGIAKLI